MENTTTNQAIAASGTPSPRQGGNHRSVTNSRRGPAATQSTVSLSETSRRNRETAKKNGRKAAGGKLKKNDGKAKAIMSSAADAIVQATTKPVLQSAKDDAEYSKLMAMKLKADLEILDHEAVLDSEDPELRANLTRDLRQAQLEQELEELRIKRQLTAKGIDLLKANLEEQKLQHELNRQTFNNLRLVKEQEEIKKEIGELQKVETHLEQREKMLRDRDMADELESRTLRKDVPSIFVKQDSLFKDNLEWLCQGQPCSGIAGMFIPPSMRATNKSWRISGTGSSLTTYVDCGVVDSRDVVGWKDSMLICELRSDRLTAAVAKTWKWSAAVSTTSAAAGVLSSKMGWSWSSTLKATAALSAAVGVATTATDMAAHIKGAKLRAIVMDVKEAHGPDTRPRDDLVSAGVKLQDRFVKIRLFAELTLLDGATVLCFDPVALNLFNWTKSSFYMLSILATEENKTFRDFWISEQQFHTIVSRHSIVVSEFEKSKAVARMSKLLEMTPAFDEDHDIRFQNGEGIFTATLRFATLVVNKDPYRDVSDF